MHQPFYKDLWTGEYRLPWTRLHAVKDYYGMVHLLREFPKIHQTFNLVPSMVAQIEEYASGAAADPFLSCALKAAEDLSQQEQQFILQYFFQANVSRMIYRYPRYAELYEMRHSRRFFRTAELRDLQVLSQLAWLDEEVLSTDSDVRALASKGKHYSREDQEVVGQKQMELMRKVLPVYREFAATGQIEISTTPYYHPILPLLCDSNIAEVAHPHVPLPSRFCYPQDARTQLERARDFMGEKAGVQPRGLWPSEGSVSDAALALAAECGFAWAASDNGVLARTLNVPGGPGWTYRSYLWSQGGREIQMLFRDHHLSDLIGFVYSHMGPAEAAAHFLDTVRSNCAAIQAEGRDALVPVILDGENAWEYYEQNGRLFLRELYSRISAEPAIEAVTVSEALARVAPKRLDHIFPGSWINANFDVWIGAEEDNQAWEFLLRARQTYDRTSHNPEVQEPDRRLAYEELLIAEGSDWNWWYGPEHDSANRPEFDQLYRDHLANMYRALKLAPPEELSRPILRLHVQEYHEPASGPIRPKIDGEVTSYFEWMGAGQYRVDSRSGAMHGHRFLLRELYYGSDGLNVFMRLDFEEDARSQLSGVEVRLQFEAGVLRLRLNTGHVEPVETGLEAEFAFRDILEVRVPLSALGGTRRDLVRFQLSLWKDGLPLGALPAHGWLEFPTVPVD